MSVRNFERRFGEQVGTSPKLFCRLLRFNKAFKSKINVPEKNWSDIAYECGYYDSLHLIKEFKQFANASPTALFNENPNFKEIELDNWVY
jgi:AraC-like DNA-binding protein